VFGVYVGELSGSCSPSELCLRVQLVYSRCRQAEGALLLRLLARRIRLQSLPRMTGWGSKSEEGAHGGAEVACGRVAVLSLSITHGECPSSAYNVPRY
jgi:hypothetical protein